MNASALAQDAFAPQRPPGMGTGLLLALVVHFLLILALAWSVHWHTKENDGIVAEIWAPSPQTAAPRAAAPEPRPEPAPAPVVKPPPPAPRPDPAEAARAEAQIAVERAAREKAQREEAERLAVEKARQADLQRREEARRAEQERERQAAEEARRKRLADEEAARQKQLAEEAARKKELAQKAKREEARLAAIREANLKRMMGQAGATGEPSSTGSAARTAGPSSGYAGRIKARIKPNILLTNPVDGNPVAEVELSLAPDGTIVGRKLVKKSASPAWDETVLRAIDRTEVLPRDIDGRVPATMLIEFRPRE